MEGLPREHSASVRASEEYRTRTTSPAPGARVLSCFSCHRTLAPGAAAGDAPVPAVVKRQEGETVLYTCRCCGAHRTLRADGTIESKPGIDLTMLPQLSDHLSIAAKLEAGGIRTGSRAAGRHALATLLRALGCSPPTIRQVEDLVDQEEATP